MKRALIAGAIFGACGLSVLPGVAAPTTSARAAIQATYDQRNAAMARKDVAGAEVGFAPDFVGISRTGQRFSLAEHQAGMPQMMAAVKRMKRTTVIQRFAATAKMAQAQTETIMAGTVQDPRTGKTITGATDTITLDVWVKSGGGWLQRQTQEVQSRRLR